MKNIFIHIPKTAGTFINGSLIASGKPTLIHCESVIDSHNFSAIIEDYEWISGHVAACTLRKKMQSLNVEANFYSMLRNPIKQLVSQICWQIEICSKTEDRHLSLRSHPQESIVRILNVLFSDLSDSSTFDKLLSRYPGYLSNNQTVTLMAEYNINLNYQAMAESDCLQCLKQFRQQCFSMFEAFKFIGSDLNIKDALWNFGVSDLSITNNVDKNKSQQFIDPLLLQNPEFIKSIIRHQLLDCILYLSYIEWNSNTNCSILEMESLDALEKSVFEHLSQSLNYKSINYNPDKILFIRNSIAECLKL